jgi:hypothetical protein
LHHYVLENPDAPEPDVWIVGRESDSDTLAAIAGHGVTVYLYPDAVASRNAAGGRL